MNNNAGYVSGSTRSRRAPLSRFTTPDRRFRSEATKSAQNPYKSDCFRNVRFISAYLAMTYNFNPLKCTDFPEYPDPAPNPAPTLRVPLGSAAESHEIGVLSIGKRRHLSLGEKARVRDKRVPACRASDATVYMPSEN